eukprot:6186550-Pleurochrysis_carterae.AAC.6
MFMFAALTTELLESSLTAHMFLRNLKKIVWSPLAKKSGLKTWSEQMARITIRKSFCHSTSTRTLRQPADSCAIARGCLRVFSLSAASGTRRAARAPRARRSARIRRSAIPATRRRRPRAREAQTQHLNQAPSAEAGRRFAEQSRARSRARASNKSCTAWGRCQGGHKSVCTARVFTLFGCLSSYLQQRAHLERRSKRHRPLHLEDPGDTEPAVPSRVRWVLV